MMQSRTVLLASVIGAVLFNSVSSGAVAKKAAAPARGKAPTVAEAKAFVDSAEARLLVLAVDASRNAWVQNTYIIHDSEILAAQANERLINAGVEYAKQAPRFDKLKLPEETARKMRLLKLGLTLAADQERRDRSHEGPEESLASMSEGMRRVRRLAAAAQPDAEEHLVHRVGGGVRGLGKHGGGSGNESGNQLRNRDDDVGKERDDDRASAFAFCGPAESRG